MSNAPLRSRLVVGCVGGLQTITHPGPALRSRANVPNMLNDEIDMTTITFQGDATLPLLADPANYRACALDLRTDDAQRNYWLELIGIHFSSMLDEAKLELIDRGASSAEAAAAANKAMASFAGFIQSARDMSTFVGPLDILQITIARQQVLEDAGFGDVFRLMKDRENAAALKRLPAVLEELDAATLVGRIALTIQGVFAGNIFDTGATETAQLFANGKSVEFSDVRQKLKPRPWLYDGLDALTARMVDGSPYRQAVLFVDNAGCDIVLGMLPLARLLLQQGTDVILTANTLPALNDITIDELTTIVEEVAASDAVIGDAKAAGRLTLIGSGNGLPLIDLTRISPELVEEVARRQVDLVVLEGMGRGVESNFNATFTCDVMKLAMLKDTGVAAGVGGALYDLVMRYDQA